MERPQELQRVCDAAVEPVPEREERAEEHQDKNGVVHPLGVWRGIVYIWLLAAIGICAGWWWVGIYVDMVVVCVFLVMDKSKFPYEIVVDANRNISEPVNNDVVRSVSGSGVQARTHNDECHICEFCCFIPLVVWAFFRTCCCF